MLEAKWYDIPVPLQAQRTCLAEIREGGYQLTYTCKNLAVEYVYQWYMREMEQAGWVMYAVYSSEMQAVLVCEKPTKRVIVTIISLYNLLTLSIFYHELSDDEVGMLHQ